MVAVLLANLLLVPRPILFKTEGLCQASRIGWLVSSNCVIHYALNQVAVNQRFGRKLVRNIYNAYLVLLLFMEYAETDGNSVWIMRGLRNALRYSCGPISSAFSPLCCVKDLCVGSICCLAVATNVMWFLWQSCNGWTIIWPTVLTVCSNWKIGLAD